MNNKKFIESKRDHICMITNHGYAGVNFPAGGAPDSGGQIIYVNQLSKTLDKLGYKVSIFTRGGFPFFNSTKIRKGVEFLSEYARYVYIEAGGNEFIRKEDIAIVLDEEVDWMYEFINKEAKKVGVKPYNYFKFINSHYWDAAIIILKLIERWKNDRFFELMEKIDFIEKRSLDKLKKDKHKFYISKNIEYYTGKLAVESLEGVEYSNKIINYEDKISRKLKKLKIEKKIKVVFQKAKKLDKPFIYPYVLTNLGKLILNNISINIKESLNMLNKHIWTPHSLGAIKERNYWNKSYEEKRKLKFLERKSYEEKICRNTPLLTATSEEVVETFINYYNVSEKNILYFPPCVDEIFKPREKNKCIKALKFLEEKTGYTKEELLNLNIIFETSRMDKTKRKDILIKAFKEVVKKVEDTILIIGGGPENNIFNELKNLKKEYPELNKKAFIVGFIPDEVIPELFSIAYIYVSPSEMEGFGMSVQQAIASRVPVVVSDLIPVAIQYLEDAALIVEHGNVKKFAQAIIKLLKQKNLRERYAEKSYKISEEFKWKKQSALFIKNIEKRFKGGV